MFLLETLEVKTCNSCLTWVILKGHNFEMESNNATSHYSRKSFLSVCLSIFLLYYFRNIPYKIFFSSFLICFTFISDTGQLGGHWAVLPPEVPLNFNYSVCMSVCLHVYNCRHTGNYLLQIFIILLNLIWLNREVLWSSESDSDSFQKISSVCTSVTNTLQ